MSGDGVPEGQWCETEVEYEMREGKRWRSESDWLCWQGGRRLAAIRSFPDPSLAASVSPHKAQT